MNFRCLLPIILLAILLQGFALPAGATNIAPPPPDGLHLVDLPPQIPTVGGLPAQTDIPPPPPVSPWQESYRASLYDKPLTFGPPLPSSMNYQPPQIATPTLMEWNNSGVALANAAFDTLSAQGRVLANQMNAALESGILIGIVEYRQSYLNAFNDMAKEINDKKLEIENRHRSPDYLNDNEKVSRDCNADQAFLQNLDAKAVAKANEIIKAGNVDQGNEFGNDLGHGLASEAKDLCGRHQDNLQKISRWVSEIARTSVEAANRRLGRTAAAERLARDAPGLDRAITKAQIREVQARVNTLCNQARETLDLPRITAQVEQAAADYIRNQLAESEGLINNAQTGLEENMSVPVARIMADFALDTVNSINSFLGGLATGAAEGVYRAALDVTQVTEAIYQNPELLEHLSNTLMHTLTSNEYISGLKADLVEFAKIVTSAPAFERGRALGDLSSILLLGLGSLERNVVGKAAIERIGGKISTETAEELTTSLISKIKKSGAISEEVAALEKVAGRTIDVADSRAIRHGPSNHGRLHELSVDKVRSVLDGGPSVADTFRSSSYLSRITQEPKKLYRVDSELIQLSTETGLPIREKLSRYYTDIRPQGPLQSQLDSALSSPFENTAKYWTEIEVPVGQTLYEGTAGEQIINPGYFMGERMPGGGPQFFIEEVPSTWYRGSGRVGE